MYYRIFMLLKRKITVKERVVIQEAYNMNSLGGLVGLVRKILIGTVVVEGIGAVFYAIQFIRDYGVAKGIWYGIFIQFLHFATQELTSLEMTVWQDTQQIL